VEPPATITCVECGGRAHLTSFAPDDGFEPGDRLVYRCEDCLERLDIIHDEVAEASDI
jgi:hypothetical protein